MAVTPGKWYAKQGPAPFYRWYVRSTDDDGCEYLVAKCHGDAEDDPGEATARLVASAPELLDACRRLLQLRCMDGHTPDNCDEVARAVGIITKAEGRGE